jgi:transaldolase
LKADASLNAEQRYEALVVPDIQAACDLLQEQYRNSQGNDGYVSLEVSPACRMTKPAPWPQHAGCGPPSTAPMP